MSIIKKKPKKSTKKIATRHYTHCNTGDPIYGVRVFNRLMNTGSPVGTGFIGGNTGSVSGMMEANEEDIVFCDYILKSEQEYLKDFDETTPEYEQAKAYINTGKKILGCEDSSLYILIADANFANTANVRSLFTARDKNTGIVVAKYSLDNIPFVRIEFDVGVLWLFNEKSHACCVLKAYENMLVTEKSNENH